MKKIVPLLTFALTGFMFMNGQVSTSITDLCSSGKKYKIELNSSSKFVKITPKDFNSKGDPYYTHQVDLNNDGKMDLIVNLKDCTDPTHCKFGVYINCDGDNYISAYDPVYWLPSFRITKEATGWKKIVLFERDLDAGRLSVKDTLKFNSKNYNN